MKQDFQMKESPNENKFNFIQEFYFLRDHLKSLKKEIRNVRKKRVNLRNSVIYVIAQIGYFITGRASKNPLDLLSKQIDFLQTKYLSFQDEFNEILKKINMTYGHENLVIFSPESIDLSNPSHLSFPKWEDPQVSIIVPMYNQVDYTIATMWSIIANTSSQIAYEVILIDDCSTQKEAKTIGDILKNVRIIRNEHNLGFLRSCNKAAEIARGSYLVFLNNDTNVQLGWLESLIEPFETKKGIGVVGSTLLYPDGTLQESGGIVWNDGSCTQYGRLDIPNKAQYSFPREVDYVSGASFIIPTEIWKRIGGFDVRYAPAYYEDTDLCFEVRSLGLKVLLQPRSKVIHFEGISHGKDLAVGLKAGQVKNQQVFKSKWNKELTKQQPPKSSYLIARERLDQRRVVLMIDRCIPKFDQDAGSRSVHDYIIFLIDQGFVVKFISDEFVNEEPYTSYFQKRGVEILYGQWFERNWADWISEYADKLSYVWINRPSMASKYLISIKKNCRAKIIFYGHDLHFLRLEREGKFRVKPYSKGEIEKIKMNEFEWMRKSDYVLYPSSHEIEIIEKTDSRINAKQIPVYLYSSFSQKERKIQKTHDLMFVGSFGHAPNEDAILWFLTSIWPKVKSKLPKVKLYIIGSKPTAEIESYKSEDIIVTGRISDEELQSHYLKRRISIAPLQYGAGIKGKIVEALYWQIPTITTTIGAEGMEGVENSLMIANDAVTFAKTLIESYDNIKYLQVISDECKNYCSRNYSHESAVMSLGPILGLKF